MSNSRFRQFSKGFLGRGHYSLTTILCPLIKYENGRSERLSHVTKMPGKREPRLSMPFSGSLSWLHFWTKCPIFLSPWLNKYIRFLVSCVWDSRGWLYNHPETEGVTAPQPSALGIRACLASMECTEHRWARRESQMNSIFSA